MAQKIYYKEICDRVEGKPMQTIQTESKVELDLSTLTDEQLERQFERITKND